MGRWSRAEDIVLPLVSFGAPIPGIAYAPLFMLWFGLGNLSAVLLVGFVSAFAIIFNTWTGVKAVKEIWVRSAQAMGADDRRAVPPRDPAGRAALHPHRPAPRAGAGLAHPGGVELLAAVPWGLGWIIFGAREFLNTDVMLAGVAVIGMVGLALEKLVFQRLEDYTVVRWGMMSMSRANAPARSCAARSPSLVAAACYELSRASGYFPRRAGAAAAQGRRTLVPPADGTMLQHAGATSTA